ncbi:hypothetical protein [Vibrio sp. WXL103]|uniref:hypothetical protein n=1 Tax=Vibrio sp. WXL103 TaxID=3450710 RepID=UPI003EC86A3E
MSLKKIDRGHNSWPEKEGYWMLFLARDYVPGHAFTVWAIRNRINNSWKAFEGYGLYLNPQAPSSKLAFGTVPGGVVKENIISLNSANNGVAVAVSKQMYDYSKNNVSAISTYPSDYNLYNKNCIHFTDLVARSISLDTPTVDDSITHPQIYINKLKDLNN